MVVNVVACVSLASSCADTGVGGTTDAMALVPGPADGASLHPRSPVNSNRAPAAASATPVQAARSDGGGPQPVTGRLLATGDGTGAALIEGVGLAVAPALALLEPEELALA